MRLIFKNPMTSLLLGIINFLVGTVQAEPPPRNCEQLKTPIDVVRCAADNHPDVSRAKAAAIQVEELAGVARQRPNPELESVTEYGNDSSGKAFAVDIDVTHTIETGGKRDSRIERAVAEKRIAEAKLQKTKEQVFLETAKALYRIRQIQIEKAILNEALSTFVKIQKQFRARPKLGPEQQVALSVFQLAEGDYRLKEANLETETSNLRTEIELAIGQPFPVLDAVLPSKKRNWPDVGNSQSFGGSSLTLSKSEIDAARAEFSAAQGDAWPNIKVGPSFKLQKQGNFDFQTYGVKLSFALPVLQANSAGQAYAISGVNRAEASLNLKQKELTYEKQILVQQYQRAVESLKHSASLADVEEKHQNTESLYERGLIPTSLVIEAHRQIFDFTKSQNEQELSALLALWRIYTLEGRLLQETI